MLPVVVTPDAEVAALDYLRPLLTGTAGFADVKLGTQVPNPLPARFVHLRRVGGSSELPGVDEARIDAICYDADDHKRMTLARQVWAIFRAAASDRAGVAVVSYTATTLGPRQMPDPADSTKRVVLLTVDLLVRNA